MNKKKYFKIAIILNAVLLFTLAFNNFFTGKYGLYFLAIPVCISIGLSIYSVMNKWSDWKIYILYGVIALFLIFLQMR